MMTVLGTLVMTANWIMCLLHIGVSSRVGFKRRDREGMFLFKAFASLCMASFLFNTALTIFPEEKGGNPLRFLLQPLGNGSFYTSIEELSFQERTAVHLFHLLVPGCLFFGYLIWPLQGFVWPFVSTWAFLQCWRRRFAPTLTARQAEKALEPLGISIAHDYMGIIV